MYVQTVRCDCEYSVLSFITSNVFAFRRGTRLPISQFSADVEGEPYKTTVSILNQTEEENLFVNSYSPIGFSLNNGLRIIGPCALFPKTSLHWNVRGNDFVTNISESLFV